MERKEIFKHDGSDAYIMDALLEYCNLISIPKAFGSLKIEFLKSYLKFYNQNFG